MDVIKPEVYWVGDRCYRKNPTRIDHGLSRPSYSGQGVGEEEYRPPPGFQRNLKQEKQFRDQPPLETGCPWEEDVEDDEEYPLEKTEGGYKTMVDNIPSGLYPMIIGARGRTKQRVETETNTRISVPRENDRSGVIIVKGKNPKDVCSARKRLEMIAEGARFKRDLTHFACIPLNDPVLVSKVVDFKRAVLEECGGSQGLDEHVFQDAEKIHLTICMLVLLDNRERNLAGTLLEEMKKDILEIKGNEALKIHLKGLEIMNDDPTQVDVLYAKCIGENLGKLQKLADHVASNLCDSGFAKEGKGSCVKLHATLINTRYRQERLNNSQIGQRGGGGGSSREYLDASDILKKFRDYDFGEIEIREVHISVRRSKAANGFYTATAKLSLT